MGLGSGVGRLGLTGGRTLQRTMVLDETSERSIGQRRCWWPKESTYLGQLKCGGFGAAARSTTSLSSKLSIKDGFDKDKARYRSHDCYKEEIVAAAENAMQAKFKDMLRAALEEQQQQPGLIVFNPSQEVG